MKKLIFTFALVFSLSLFAFSCKDSSDSEDTPEQKDALALYKETVAAQKYIIHALGGDEADGTQYTYINSVDVLKKWYAKGFRLFEVDVWETSDGELVLSHRSGNDGSLTSADCARLGLEYPANPSYAEFMKCRVYGMYAASSFADLVKFCEIDGGGYYMIDIQNRSYDDTKRIYQKIYDAAKGNAAVLDHFIAGGWTSDMIRACRDVYAFPALNLYWAAKAVREFEQEGDFVSYCKSAGIASFSTSTGRFTESNYPSQLAENLISYVFTTNDEEAAQSYFGRGATCVGTDFLGVEEADD